MRSLLITILTLFVVVPFGFSQDDVWMHPNRGQWDDRFNYKLDLNIGEILIEDKSFCFFLSDAKVKHHHEHGGEEGEVHDHEEEELYQFHVVRKSFLGTTWAGVSKESEQSHFYRNFIVGDPSRWRSKIYSCKKVEFDEFYPGIKMELNTMDMNLEYAFEIAPGSDPSIIQMKYEGQNSQSIDEDGNLIIGTNLGDILESPPIAWTIKEGYKEKVEVLFKLEDGILSFEFPDEYDRSATLFIDPNLTFSTFTGSQADNWGMSATPDLNGNLFGGGSVFEFTSSNGTVPALYPTTVGAYSTAFNGGEIDVGITKFNDDGTAMIYSTYLGGAGEETPNSIVANDVGELYVFGITSSPNFPMAGTPFDNTYAGGPNVLGTQYGLGFTGGSDIYIARLSADGTTLLASTYVGGTDVDGMNESVLEYNYGDAFRGDITLDDNGNIYVASTTRSADFPIVGGSQAALQGTQDAVIFKMTPNLNLMIWSTFYGGSGEESGNSVRVAVNGDVLVCGGTNSNNLNVPGGHMTAYGGGLADAYVTRFNGTNSNVLSGTYAGSMEYDQAYFVDLDIDDRVYIYGQTNNNWGVTPGHYGVANSGQFIRKYAADLSAVEWSTMIGAGTGEVEISPTAFLISDCYDIYFAGWGGQLNVSYGQAAFSTTNGFPVTFDAHQNATNGSNFYLGVLDQDAINFKYGTFMGGTSTAWNHVDGGTSRFDKQGRVYHSVCGSCGSAIIDGFTTTMGVVSNTANSANCNMAVFKFDLNAVEAIVSTPNAIVCIPDPVIFNNGSLNGNTYFWNFGDGNTSTVADPIHYYTSPGVYTVTLIVSDSMACRSADSVQLQVTIEEFIGGIIQPTIPVCPDEPFQFQAYGGSVYEWSPAQYLSDPNIDNPVAIIDQTTTFMCIISDTCGIDTAYATLQVYPVNIDVSPDTSVCIGGSVNLSVTGATNVQWSPPDYLDDPNSLMPISTPPVAVTYVVDMITGDGCTDQDTVHIDVFYNPPMPIMPDFVDMCSGGTVDIEVSGADDFTWSPNQYIDTLYGPSVTVWPPGEMYFYCLFENACGQATDSTLVQIRETNINAFNDTIVCPGETATIWAEGGMQYSWYPLAGLSSSTASLVYATPSYPTSYSVIGTDQYGCVDTAHVFVDLFPQPFIQTVPDVHAFIDDEIQLGATTSTSGQIMWSPSEYLSCVVCPNPVAIPNQNYTYIATYTDMNGCSASDAVKIYYDPILYVPNTFTPDGNTYNNTFFAVGGNIDEFRMDIFNRWGELIYTLHSLDDFWDGTYEGNICQDGTYTWKVQFSDFEGIDHERVGHVNLLR